MADAKWKPTNEPGRYDKARLAYLEPLRQAIAALGLPLIRQRKLNGILNALTMQIEDSGDNPEVNDSLLAALKAGIQHQVGPQKGQEALRALGTFAKLEAERWRQVQAGTLPPIALTPVEQLDELIQTGYSLFEQRRLTAACDQWLAAWEILKQLVTPTVRSTEDLDKTYRELRQFLSNWTMDLMFELHNAGMDKPTYHEQRLRYAREFLALFPDEDEDRYLEFRRAEGEALWLLGRIAEAEAVYQALVAKLPDKAWGYIGWSDEYYLANDSPKDYQRAEAILQQALARPTLDDRQEVFDRLQGMYREWGKPEQAAAAELATWRGRPVTVGENDLAG